MVFAAAALHACATKNDYSQVGKVPPLEVPPDLSSPDVSDNFRVPLIDEGGEQSYAGFSSRRQDPIVDINRKLLPEFEAVRIERAGSQRWLVVRADAEPLWYEIRSFLLKNGFLIAKQNPQTGIMETEWREHRPLVASKAKNKLSQVLGSMYSTGQRDKFRLRLERGLEPGTLEIYLSHRRMEEVVASGGGGEVVHTVWQQGSPDPELEMELLGLLMVALGENAAKLQRLAAESTRGTTQGRASLGRSDQGRTRLTLNEDYELSWRRVGLALDRIGFTVEDRDRNSGVYYVRYSDPAKETDKPGFFSRLFGGDKKKASQSYLVRLKPTGGGTDVEVLNQGGMPERSKTGERILSLLHEQLK